VVLASDCSTVKVAAFWSERAEPRRLEEVRAA
jgi:hypothetical protein